jgi:hypothetical protein
LIDLAIRPCLSSARSCTSVFAATQHALGGLSPLLRGHRDLGGRERPLQALGEPRIRGGSKARDPATRGRRLGTEGHRYSRTL